jgi:hypothetical protein
MSVASFAASLVPDQAALRSRRIRSARRPLKILLAYKASPWIAQHVVPSFQRLDAHLEQFDYRTPDSPLARSLMSATLRDRVASGKFDVVFVVEGMDDQLDADILDAARRGGATVINYLVDVPQDWWRSLDVASCCDLTLTAQTQNADRLAAAGGRVVHFPFAVDEAFAREGLDRAAAPITPKELGRPLFTGSAHSRWRKHFVGRLDQMGVELDVVGGGWTVSVSAAAWDPRASGADPRAHGWRRHLERLRGSGLSPLVGGAVNRMLPDRPRRHRHARFRGFLSHSDMMDAAARTVAHVSTSVHGSGYLVGQPRRQIKLRDVEFLCLGAPYLTDVGEEVRAFAPDTDLIVPYWNVWEAPELIRELIADPMPRRSSGPAQAAHMLEHHTWRRRLEDLSHLTQLPLVTR